MVKTKIIILQPCKTILQRLHSKHGGAHNNNYKICQGFISMEIAKIWCSYKARESIREQLLRQMSTCCSQVSEIWCDIVLQCIGDLAILVGWLPIVFFPSRNYGLSNCINVMVKLYKRLFLTDEVFWKLQLRRNSIPK